MNVVVVPYLTASLLTLLAGLAAMAGLGSFWRRAKTPSPTMTNFFGSQIGGKAIINYSYTDMPWKLMAFDIYYFFAFIWALPHILVPITPTDSGDLAELSLTAGNLFCILVHVVLCVLQLGFIVAIPALVLLPLWTAVLAVGLFLAVNHLLCMLINGKGDEYNSDPAYAPALPEHAHEQWIFINGVAVGEHWMQSNLNRLALTFKRPILGVHNKTSGIIFDVVECLVQRNLGYATTDVRVCYRIIKEKLYNPQYSKVIFLLHSQGAIEGSMILDWLLQELPQDLLAKLEVYTFGNAANHFNNPHRHLESQHLALDNPLAASTDSTNLASPRSGGRAPLLRQPSPGKRQDQPQPAPETKDNATTAVAAAAASSSSSSSKQQQPASPSSFSLVPALTFETSSLSPAAVSDRAIGHIEHYAFTTDFVALWGVLHFATSAPGDRSLPRFMGRVFVRTSARGGHQFCQHYLDGMFPLEEDKSDETEAGGEGSGGTGGLMRRMVGGMTMGLKRKGKKKFVGCLENGNDFMESEIVIGADGDEMASVREGMGVSWLSKRSSSAAEDKEVEIHDGSPVEQKRGRFRSRIGAGAGAGSNVDGDGRVETTVKVKELSRLWQYRNGKSPTDTPPSLAKGADGFARMATL